MRPEDKESQHVFVQGTPTKLQLVDEHDVAGITKVSVSTVRRWRFMGQGPRFIKLGAAVRYRLDDVVAWLESR